MRKPTADIVNGTEIRAVGMSRSGNHAIIGWILAQAQGRTCLLNCAEAKTNPFESCRPIVDETGASHIADFAGFDIDAEREGVHARKDLLIHSYEDTFLGPLADRATEREHDRHVGASARRIDLLILRDPYNLFASRLASGIGHIGPQILVRMWVQHASEFLELRTRLPNETVCVSYNDWVSSRDARRRLADRLGLRFDDSAAHQVPRTAGGSSFDGTAHDGRALRMGVLDRWRHYVDDPAYRALFDDKVHALAEQAFGELPAVHALRGTGSVAA